MNTIFRSAILYNPGELPDAAGILETVGRLLAEQLPNAEQVTTHSVTNKQNVLEETLTRLADEDQVSLLVTIGGIGPTGYMPDVTQAVCNKLFPGFGTILRQTALRTNPAAILWRNTAGLRHQTLIVNLPDSFDAILIGFPLLFPAIPNAIRLAGGKINQLGDK